MPTIIDELIVTLGLDPKEFVSGQKKAADALLKTKTAAKEGTKEVSEGAGTMLKAFNGLQGKLLGVAALFTGGLGITEFSRKMAAMTTQTTQLSHQLGISANDLEAWGATAAKVGATAGEITASIASLRQEILTSQSRGVSSRLAPFNVMMGVSPFDKNGKAKDINAYLLEVSKWGRTQKPEFAANIFHQMGLGNGLTNLLMEGPDKLRSQLEENKKYALSDSDRKKFEDLNTSFHQLAVDAERLGRAISIHLLPSIKSVVDFLDWAVTRFKPASPEDVKKFTDEKLPNLGGSKSIFGRVKSWWNGSNSTGEASKSESGADVAPSTPPAPPASPSRPTAGGNDLAPSGARARAAAAKGFMMDQLRREGVPAGNLNAAASLLAGQAIAESNLRPDLTHDGGTGYGIYGARLDRRTRMLAWLKANGYAANSLEGQSRYMAREAMTDPRFRASRAALVGATPDNMAAGTRVLTRNFEAPAVDNSAVRHNQARGVLGIPAPGTDIWASGAAGIVPHPGLMAFQNAGSVAHNSTATTNVQNLIVNTPSNDPNAHAAEITSALRRTSAMDQSNLGPN